MNQILGKHPKLDFSYENKKKFKYKLIFYFFILLSILSIILFILFKYNSFKKEKISKNLVNNFNITTLYSTSNDYSSTLSNTSSNEPFVIGIIEISKIDLLYPILSSASKESLSISPCRFYGPMPNEVGNLCIAGHNNANDKLFGRLDLLKLNDIIQIYDLNGNSINYFIYDKQTISYDDTSCMNQNTNGRKELTLITCNNRKNSRLLLKAKEEGSN